MASIMKPMLAATCEDLGKLRYPILCTPKLDGIRCLIRKGQAVSRSFKLIPNKYLQAWLSKLPEGLDGELMLPKDQFYRTSSAVMGEEGEPEDIQYYVFDYVKEDIAVPYDCRMSDLRNLKLGAFNEAIKWKVIKLLPTQVNNETELLEYETKCLADGYEGAMIRSSEGPYKEGRSTEREGYLLKLKKTLDSEAEILGVQEKQHNGNKAEKDAFGRMERSSHKAKMVPMATLGALLVRDVKTGVKFSVGSGYDDVERSRLWNMRLSLPGQIIIYKFQNIGVKTETGAPRFPIYKGIRDKKDM